MATAQEQLEGCLEEAFQPLHLDIVDESHRHAGHAGAAGGGGHFQVLIVSKAFDGLSLVDQHRLVNGAVRDLLGGVVHALGLRTVPASQWKGPTT